VPCSNSIRSRSSLVDILGEDNELLVECQGEREKVRVWFAKSQSIPVLHPLVQYTSVLLRL